MKSYKEFLNEDKTKSAQEIADYITYITPDSSDVPDFFIEKILKSNKTFTLKKLKNEINTIYFVSFDHLWGVRANPLHKRSCRRVSM